jgi:prolyl-tRNA synthetase
MRASQFFIATLKEAPSDAEIVSHQLMLRAGLIRRLAGGIYTWMPMGLRVLRKVENIVREEMDRAGAIELLMPAVQPFELWEESGRGPKYGPELLRFKDRHQRDFVIGPTHEEVITDVVRREVKSYRQLPRHFYQIQTKFRDEIRPRFGVMRGREFLMKDGYSFHTSYADLEREYRNMYDTYSRIFTARAEVPRRGGRHRRDRRHRLARIPRAGGFRRGRDRLLPGLGLRGERGTGGSRGSCKVGAGAAANHGNEGHAEQDQMRGRGRLPRPAPDADGESHRRHGDERDEGSEFVLLLLRGDHDLNEIKAQKVVGEFRFARDEEIVEALGCKAGYIGAVGFSGRVVADRSVAVMSDMVCGANEEGYHLTGVNFGRDLPQPASVADIRNVVEGDPSPDGKGTLELCRGIEVGHIFQLRTKYAEALKCTFLDEQGKDQVMEMGCYGIGVSRIVGAAIEQGHDERGIIFPAGIAPFAVAIVPMNYAKSETVRTAAAALHAELLAAGIDAILDDRDERPGSMFADWELIGVPHRVVVGERGLKEGKLEYKGRSDAEATMVAAEEMKAFLQQKLCG